MMAALEEDIGEIGTMKAIGFNFKDIRSQYLTKYRILAFIGVGIGTTLAMLMSRSLTGHIRMTFGEIKFSWMTVGLSLIASLCVYGLVLFYCRRVLKKIKNVSVYDALVSGKGFEKQSRASKDGLHRSKKCHINWVMSLREVFYRFKQWVVVFIIVWMIGFMIIVPINLTNTFNSPTFITYMGSSLEDIFIEIENGENLLENRNKVVDFLAQEASVTSYFEIKSVNVQVDNQRYNLHIDSGHAAGKDLQYLSGYAPEGGYEIALSYLNAQLLEKNTGDSIFLTFNNETFEFDISGIYQDVTSGGYTAKSQFNFEGIEVNKFAFLVNVVVPSESKKIAMEWSNTLNQGISVQPMDAFINQTLGGVVKQLQLIVIIIAVLGIGIAGLITVLFLKLRLAKDSSQIAILNAIGFSEREIKQQYMIKTGAITSAGVLFSIVTTQLLGNTVINFALSFTGLGIKRVDLVPNLWIQYFVWPTILLMIILSVAWTTLKMVKKYHIMSLIKE
jgi:putative ABC transport system permease protein